ncbi:MAG: hypothetical protein ACRDTR_09340 [Rubrobacter sp.]
MALMASARRFSPSFSPSLSPQLVVDPGGFHYPLQGVTVLSHTAKNLGCVPGIAGFARSVPELAVYLQHLEVRPLRAGVIPLQPANVAQLPVSLGLSFFAAKSSKDLYRRLPYLLCAPEVGDGCECAYAPNVDLRDAVPASETFGEFQHLPDRLSTFLRTVHVF